MNDHDIYQDLMRCFQKNGDSVYVVTCAEKRKGLQTELYESCGCRILRVKIGNQSGCSLIEKGISTLLIENQFKKAIKKYFNGVKFNLVLYATPPITIAIIPIPDIIYISFSPA